MTFGSGKFRATVCFPSSTRRPQSQGEAPQGHVKESMHSQTREDEDEEDDDDDDDDDEDDDDHDDGCGGGLVKPPWGRGTGKGRGGWVGAGQGLGRGDAMSRPPYT